jgi:hypothetical protein
LLFLYCTYIHLWHSFERQCHGDKPFFLWHFESACTEHSLHKQKRVL